MLTLRILRARRGASLTEYAALAALLGGVSIGAVLALGGEAVQGSETATTALEEAFYVSEAPPASGGGSGTPGGGETTPPPPPADPFASCEANFGPNPAAIRGNGDGSTLVGGADGQVIYALASALVDGGEAGADTDTLFVPGAGAVAAFTSWAQPESGRVDLPDGGAVVFANIERLVLCDEGGDIAPPTQTVPAVGEWAFSLYSRDFSSMNNQTGTITSGAVNATGFIDGFNVRDMIVAARAANSVTDFGAVFDTPLEINTGGSYTFAIRSASGSRLILRDAGGAVVFNLNNDYHQPATTRSASVSLAPGAYTAQLLFWNNIDPNPMLSATISGPDTSGAAQSLAGYLRVGTAP